MTHGNPSFAELAMQTAEQYARHAAFDPDDVADAVSVAWELAQAGRGNPMSVAQYAVKRVRARRQFGESVRSMTSRKRPRGRAAKPKREWMDIHQIARTGGDPAKVVAFRIDFTEWRASLPPKYQWIVDRLASGATTGELARWLDVSPAAVSQYRKWLADSYYARFADRPE